MIKNNRKQILFIYYIYYIYCYILYIIYTYMSVATYYRNSSKVKWETQLT